MKRKKQSKQEGYVLLEIIVALGIFLVVLMIGMSAVVAMFGANKRIQALKSVINNLNIALDSVSREVIVGTRYHCGSGDPETSFPKQDCVFSGSEWMTFCSSEDQRIFYRHQSSGGYLEKAVIEESNCILPNDENWWIESNPLSDWQRITAPEVNINDMAFYVSGSVPPQEQPRVLITVEGQAGPDYDQTGFEIQTTISQRTPDLSILEQP